jgi:hypothetical protein
MSVCHGLIACCELNVGYQDINTYLFSTKATCAPIWSIRGINASGGYPLTIVPLEQRNVYMAALEEAITNHNIEPFTNSLGALVQASLDGKAEPSLPND